MSALLEAIRDAIEEIGATVDAIRDGVTAYSVENKRLELRADSETVAEIDRVEGLIERLTEAAGLVGELERAETHLSSFVTARFDSADHIGRDDEAGNVEAALRILREVTGRT
ncbi:hypothetical protein [Falsiroseomonas sp. CW058]|uniref:hypothetical protein n=1 Tax=Falsiroseomonas sp. CW058 TaxID=3388664 RepID=UPI003D313FAB